MGKILPSPAKDVCSREQDLPQQRWHGHLWVTSCLKTSLMPGEGKLVFQQFLQHLPELWKTYIQVVSLRKM